MFRCRRVEVTMSRLHLARLSASQDFWPTIQQIEKWYDKIDDEVFSDHSDSPRVRRRRSLDDVPDPSRQKRPPEERLSEEQIRKKFRGEFFQTVMVATAVEDFQDTRSEVKKLRRLLGMPITAARLHKQPRKRTQRLCGGKKRGRVVVVLSKQAGAAMVSQETLEEVQQQPRRKAHSVHQAGGSESRGEHGLCSTGGGIFPGESHSAPGLERNGRA